MAAKENREKRLYWQGVIKRQADSGLSIRQFCSKERVSEFSFYAWRRKLAQSQRGKKRSERASRRPSSSGNGQGFIPLEVVESSGTLELVHPLGYRIRITGEVNVRELQRVLEVLDGRSHG